MSSSYISLAHPMNEKIGTSCLYSLMLDFLPSQSALLSVDIFLRRTGATCFLLPLGLPCRNRLTATLFPSSFLSALSRFVLATLPLFSPSSISSYSVIFKNLASSSSSRYAHTDSVRLFRPTKSISRHGTPSINVIVRTARRGTSASCLRMNLWMDVAVSGLVRKESKSSNTEDMPKGGGGLAAAALILSLSFALEEASEPFLGSKRL
mmetsp:Transcript_5114/g.14718  ORF Transcript_5114/g.14718 Transcript_5114/m.14718 type:complete len:208 (+) Transcript_5114:2691-3314(+)